jgi:lysine 2,3-aminomutase
MSTPAQDAAWSAAVKKSSGEVLTSLGSDLADDHRQLRDDDFWRRIPAYSRLSAEEFNDHRFQSRNSITSVRKLREILGSLVSDGFWEDAERGVRNATMSVRISPYIVSLIDWSEPYGDPLRTQFLPLASRTMPDHPELRLDSLNEQADSPVSGLTHRYRDRGLFLALDTCPVYCRFCTRSYSVGLDTEEVEKARFGVNAERWEDVFSYVANHPELEDIVISGGDAYNLKPKDLKLIGDRLLDIDHIRRLRFATKGPAVMPQKLLTDDPWVAALRSVFERGRREHKQVALHTHFNHPREITALTKAALDRLTGEGIVVRNQAVLQRGVNDDPDTMKLLVLRLGYVNVQPYYVFLHDMVKGVEELRTTLAAAQRLEKEIRGVTAGFHMPNFVVDTMGGGGKRHVHSHEFYDRELGIAVFLSPEVRPGELFLFFDPIHELSEDVGERWLRSQERRAMIAGTMHRAREICK